MDAMFAGDAFIRPTASDDDATPAVTLVLLERSHFHHATGVMVGMKPAGGNLQRKAGPGVLSVILYATMSGVDDDRPVRFGASSNRTTW